MKKELYFLRSSEAMILNKLIHYADKTQEEFTTFTQHYGLSTKDLGLYALVENKVAGAIWSRELDNNIPVLSMAILPVYENKEIESFMMEQFLQEAAAMYEQITVSINDASRTHFYENFGFKKQDTSGTFTKKLEKKEVIRPSDGYDPRRWMD